MAVIDAVPHKLHVVEVCHIQQGSGCYNSVREDDRIEATNITYTTDEDDQLERKSRTLESEGEGSISSSSMEDIRVDERKVGTGGTEEESK